MKFCKQLQKFDILEFKFSNIMKFDYFFEFWEIMDLGNFRNFPNCKFLEFSK